MDKKYTVIVKTGEAEIRAIENIENIFLDKIFPVIEITRGRKRTIEGIEKYPFKKRLERIKKVFKGHTVCIDLTSDELLSSDEIEQLYMPKNGYENWVNFLVSLKEDSVFREIIPTLILNMDDDDYNTNLIKQIKLLKSHFKSILYRNSISDKDCYEDFELLKKYLTDIDFYVLLDCSYFPQASFENIAKKSLARINNIKSILGDNSNFIICSNSFPNNVSQIGNDDTDTFSLSEIKIYNLLLEDINNVQYGDYASINPIRNDTVLMPRGWIPRIDVPLSDKIYYYRKRRPKGVSAYASTYINVAQLVKSDNRFPINLDCWGIKQIKSCADGAVPAASPSFWISVRMNIHIMQQIKRLFNLNI